MQIRGLHKSIYTLERYSFRQENEEKRKNHPYYPLVRDWEKLRESGVKASVIQEILGVSRATYYRYRKAVLLLKPLVSRRPKRLRVSKIPMPVIHQIFEIRFNNPTYGKSKLVAILRRDFGVHISESSVGRVLFRLIETGKIKRSLSAGKTRRKRVFKGHAKAWRYGDKAHKPGILVQMDHMSVRKHDCHFKHFQAYDPITKTAFAEIYHQASSRTAKSFLINAISAFPFKIQSIQVDGGSEFMKDFEEACKERGIALFILPPRRPQWNGCVERSNRIFREEFYAREDLDAETMDEFRAELKKALDKYNNYRPHHALKGLTPNEYTRRLLQVA